MGIGDRVERLTQIVYTTGQHVTSGSRGVAGDACGCWAVEIVRRTGDGDEDADNAISAIIACVASSERKGWQG